MYVTYFRSSSLNSFRMCEAAYAFEYFLGLPTKSGLAAEKGNVVHKALELLATQKKAEQDGEPEFYNDEIDAWWKTGSLEVEEALEQGWQLYVPKSQNKFAPKDRRECEKWTWMALTEWDGLYDIRKRHIVQPEQYFELEIDEPWAAFDYEIEGRRVHGKLGIKGTMDLVLGLDVPQFLELADWKTGARKDWATGDVKDYKKLRKDVQLRLYHYAVCKLFPDIEEFLVTIVFIKDGGPFTIPLGRNELPETLDILESFFSRIRACERPKQNRTWKCKKFCHFGKNTFVKDGVDTGIEMCEYLSTEIRKRGLDAVLRDHGDASKISSYGDGGGRSAKDE